MVCEGREGGESGIERERDRETETERQRDRETERQREGRGNDSLVPAFGGSVLDDATGEPALGLGPVHLDAASDKNKAE